MLLIGRESGEGPTGKIPGQIGEKIGKVPTAIDSDFVNHKLGVVLPRLPGEIFRVVFSQL